MSSPICEIVALAEVSGVVIVRLAATCRGERHTTGSTRFDWEPCGGRILQDSRKGR
jgi:hypothetical protein